MLLTCPNCRCGLEVPDGTDALVRCPGCQTVFAPADSPAPLPPPPPPPPAPPASSRRIPRDPPPSSRRIPRDEPPPRRRSRRDPEPEPEPERRSSPPRPQLSAKQLKFYYRTKGGFERAMWGCRLVWGSVILYILSLLLVVAFYAASAVPAIGEMPGLYIVAGILALLNWAVGAVGVGLCLSGPPARGLLGYGITAAVVVVVHGILLVALVNSPAAANDLLRKPTEEAGGWAQLPTEFIELTGYLGTIAYKRQGAGVHIVAGLLEMLRAVFVMLTLSCLARAAGSDEFAMKCVQSAAVVSVVPGAMILATLGYTVFMEETNFKHTTGGKIVIEMAAMVAHVAVAFMLLHPMGAARDVADACSEPTLPDD